MAEFVTGVALVQSVFATLKTIQDFATAIDNLADDWYNVPEDKMSELETLRKKMQIIVSQFGMQNVTMNDFMEKKLKRADKILKIEEEKLRGIGDYIKEGKSRGGVRRVFAKVTMIILFPQRMEKVIKRVRTELNELFGILVFEGEAAEQVAAHLARQSIPEPRRHIDPLYVPIEKSVTEITAELEKPDGFSIVLLHGGVGQGKSSLAQHLRAGYDGLKFEQVYLLPCGNRKVIPDHSALQIQVLKALSPGSVYAGGDNAEKICENNLKGFLSDKNILIILDDLLDPEFLRKMSDVRGKDCKYLVTSWDRTLCNRCATLRKQAVVITMKNPSLEEARKILASLVGLERQEIPCDLEDIADDIIIESEKNPLALACVAGSFLNDESVITERYKWEQVSEELCELLNKPGNVVVYGCASKSLWAAMELCINSLENEDAKKLLFLMSACEGPSIPEEVLKILFGVMNSRKGTFHLDMEELGMRELVKRSAGDIEGRKSNDIAFVERPAWRRRRGTREMPTRAIAELLFEGKIHKYQDHNLQRSTVWSLRSLVKLYIEKNLSGSEEARSVIAALETGKSKEAKVAAALCALYFDPTHPDEVVSSAAMRAKTASISASNFNNCNNTRRDAIEPLTRLLGEPVNNHTWTAGHLQCVREVFLEYICEGRLEVTRIATLLRLIEHPIAPLATLRAVREICRVEERPLLGENSKAIFEALAELLDHKNVKKRIRKAVATSKSKGKKDLNEIFDAIQEETCSALVVLSWKAAREKVSFLVSGTPSLLQGLERVLHDSNASHSSRVQAAQTLWNLVLAISTQELALSRLVEMLAGSSEPGLCEPAVEALYSVACGLDSLIIRKIVDLDWALSGLVMAFDRSNPQLRTSAAMALGILAWGPDERTRMEIVNHDGVLNVLTRSLEWYTCPYFQERAASALANLSMGHDIAPKLTIVNHKRNNRSEDDDKSWVVESLVWSLKQTGNPGLQKRAARAVGNLAIGGKEDKAKRLYIVKKIVDEGAVACLYKLCQLEISSIAEVATQALKNLLDGMDEEIEQKIRCQEGAPRLDELVRFVKKDSDDEDQDPVGNVCAFTRPCPPLLLTWPYNA